MSQTNKTAIQLNTLPAVGFVRLPQILNFIPVSRATWWRWVRAGKAPQGKKLGPKTTAVNAQEINQFLEQLNAQKEG